MRVVVFGAAGEVTGSCYLVETGQARVLVEFGLHQGGPEAERRNRRMLPLEAERLDAVVLTHAHLDHSGRLPMLHKASYAGRIFATPATIELCEILLMDAAHLQEMDAERTNRRRRRRGGKLARPLYTTSDVERVLPMFEAIAYDAPRAIAPGVTARFVDAGHILGSASLELTVTDAGRSRTLVFSGDIGPRGAPLLRDPVTFTRADLVFLESTYGDRDHRPLADSIDELHAILESARSPRGKVLIPAFAVGRTQQLIYVIGELRRQGRLHDPRVYLDSPMAITTTDLYRRHRDLFDDDAWAIIDAGDTCLRFPGLHLARTPEDSMAINPLGDGVVVISAAGMMSGGRILHHLKHALWREQTHLVVVGYQAKGTLGRRIVDGAEMVRVMGEPIRVNAKVHTLGGFSAHCGQTELIEWLAPIAPTQPRVVLTHGENGPRKKLSERIKRDLGLDAERPDFGAVVEM